MSTVRTAIRQAMHLLKAAAPGDDPVADELVVGLEAAQAMLLELHEARGPMANIDVPGFVTGQTPPTSGTVCPGENQRLRVASGFTLTLQLPESVSIFGTYDPYDYGFEPSAIWDPQLGSTNQADGVYWRAPHDGARIEVIQAGAQALYFYRADLDTWSSATGLTLDAELPLNSGQQGHFAAILAERLADVLGNLPQPTPAQKARIAAARGALFTRPGVRREPVRASYF